MNWVQDAVGAVRTDDEPPKPEAEIVLLHGWGSDARVMEALGAALGVDRRVIALDLPGFGSEGRQAFPSDAGQLVADLKQRIPAGATVVGWSLGGAIALLLAEAFPRHLRAVVTIATNPCFLQAPGWQHAMDRAGFAVFRASIAGDAETALGRFAALQVHGDEKPREVLRALRHTAAEGARKDDLLRALDLLSALDLRALIRGLQLPLLQIFGERDALVPWGVATDCRRLQPHASVWVIEGAAHVPFLSRTAAVAARIGDFLRNRDAGSPAPQRDKAEVARSFGRAAQGYENVARLQRSTGAALLEMLPASGSATVVDLGSGTGYFAPALRARYPRASIIGLDIAEAMVREAQVRHGSILRGVCADAEQLPLAAGSVDVIFSNLALQWCEDLPRALREIARALASGGRATVCTLGADTLWELREAWRGVDRSVHVNRFADTRTIAAAAHRAGLEVAEMRQHSHILHYPDVRALARELQQLGAHNMNRGRRNGLAGRSTWEQLQNSYLSFATRSGLPATYQAVFLRLKKTHG